MSDFHDDFTEMGRADEAAFEALLAGRDPGGAESADLTRVVENLRQLRRSAVPRPTGALGALLAGESGLAAARSIADQGDPPATAASNAYGPAAMQVAGLPTRRLTTMKNTLTGLTTKLAGLGVAAKLALAAGVAAASVGGLAAAAAAGHGSTGQFRVHHESGPGGLHPADVTASDSASPEVSDSATPEPAVSDAPDSPDQTSPTPEASASAEPADTESPDATESPRPEASGAETESPEPDNSQSESAAPESSSTESDSGSSGSTDSSPTSSPSWSWSGEGN